ncbi:MAG: hypothetical protein COZ18_02045 [Flexibacter sp. CG_4_10_14_3_um_filter_32_15]|nr:MAG: hypothetical protein COZ18_02045 [Flexibacter sp. CG_4_10_14_3_um_filter_32_15]
MNKISVLLLALLCFQFVSCEKGDIIKQNGLQKEVINPSELTRLVSEYEVSQEHDAITFFIGRAFEEIISQDVDIQKQLLSSLKVG